MRILPHIKTSQLFLGLILLLLVLQPNQAADILDDLVMALTFDEGNGDVVVDKSGQGNDAKIDGSAKWIDGKIGGGFQFDGKTWVVAPHIPFNDKDFTIQFWVKSDMLSGAEEVVFSQHELNSKNLSLHLRLYSTGKVRLGYYSNDLDTDAGLVKKGAWHNLTFCVDNGKKTRTIYVDGEMAKRGPAAEKYLGKKGDTIIGGWNRVDKGRGKAYQLYMGAVDEVRVWHRALSLGQIQLSMRTEMPVEAKGKLAHLWGKIKRTSF